MNIQKLHREKKSKICSTNVRTFLEGLQHPHVPVLIAPFQVSYILTTLIFLLFTECEQSTKKLRSYVWILEHLGCNSDPCHISES